MKKRILIAGGILVVLLIIVLNLVAGGPSGEAVTVAEVEQGRVVSRVSASGKVYPVIEVKITSLVSARIDRLLVVEGQQVRKGDVLVELDRTIYQARVDAARAALQSARANLEAAEASLRQAEDLLSIEKAKAEQGLGMAQQLKDAQNSRDAAAARRNSSEAQVTSAEANLAQAQDDLSRTTIRAPMDGTVTALAVEAGEMVLGTQMTMGSQMMAISDLSRMEVEVEVDETDVVAVQVGQDVEVEVDALPGQILKGRVTEIANAGTTRGQGTQMEVTNFAVKALLVDPNEHLRPGMSAAVDIVTAVHEDALNVPIQAITARRRDEATAVSNTQEEPADTGSLALGEDEYEEVVFVVTDEGTVERRPIKTGITGTSVIEILEGLQKGEKVVTGPFRALSRILKDGDPVHIEEETVTDPQGGSDE